MGGVKKVFKSIGGLIGLGGSSSTKTQVVQVTPEPTPTVVTDASADTGADTDKKKKKRRGFASTQLAGPTIMGESTSSGRSTLG